MRATDEIGLMKSPIIVFILVVVLGTTVAVAQPKIGSKNATLFLGDEVSVVRCGMSGRYVLPVTPEGPFPRYAIGTAIYLFGPGRDAERGKSREIVYDFIRTARDKYDCVQAGTVHVSLDKKSVTIAPTDTDGRWSPVLTGKFSVQDVLPVITGTAAEFFLSLYHKSANDVVRVGLETNREIGGIPGGDLVISFLVNEHIGDIKVSSACTLRGIVLLWNGDKCLEYDLLKIPETERTSILQRLAQGNLTASFADGWQAKHGTTKSAVLPSK